MTVSVTKKDKERYDKAAMYLNMTQSEFMRYCLDKIASNVEKIISKRY